MENTWNFKGTKYGSAADRLWHALTLGRKLLLGCDRMTRFMVGFGKKPKAKALEYRPSKRAN